MRNISVLEIDLAKTSFQLHGADLAGRAVLRRKCSHSQMMQIVANLPPILIAMEACAGSHGLAGKFEAFGHQVKLLPPRLVKPFVIPNKSDKADAEAIVEPDTTTSKNTTVSSRFPFI